MKETEEALIKDLASALIDMYDQYCGEHGHSFMSAGEHASAVLEQYGYGIFDDGGRVLKWGTKLS